MFNKNYFDRKSIKYKIIKLPKFYSMNSNIDESIMDISSSPLSYNFDCTTGVLKDGMGIRKLRFKSYPDDNTFKDLDTSSLTYHLTACWLANCFTSGFNTFRSIFIAQDSNGDFYYNLLHGDSTALIKIDGLHFDDEPLMMTCNMNGEDFVVFISKRDGVYLWQYPYIVKKIDGVPPLKSICVHNNKLFAIPYNNQTTVMFTDVVDISNLNMDAVGSGKIELKDGFGACNKVISFKNYLYVFRDFGISKVVDYANRVDVDISQVCVSGGRIFDKTICVCGDNILYLASDGIYSFNGTTTKRLNFKLDKMFEGVDNYNAVACYSDGYYYISCKLNYKDDSVVDGEWSYGNNYNNALIKLNLETGEMVLFRGYDIIGLYVINDVYRSEICVLVREVGAVHRLGMLDTSGAYYGEPLTKVWNSARLDCGCPEKYKIIKEISLETSKDIDIEINTEIGKRVFRVKGKDVYQTIKVNLKCKKFSVNFVSKSTGNYIVGLQIVVGIL